MTPGTTAVNRGCNGAQSFGFKYYSKEKVRGTRRSVVVGDFGLGANAHVLLVAYEGDTVLGVEALSPPPGVVVEGVPVPFERSLTGEHTIRVVMYADEDGDGKFDAESATPCRYEGEVVQAGPKTIDFSAFTPSTTTIS